MESENNVSVADVKNYWENHPLLSYELNAYGTDAFFDEFDRIKREDAEKYSEAYWAFNKYAGKKVLDIGCGPGWISMSYARGGAIVDGIDLTSTAVAIARKHCAYRKVNASINEGNAENLNFPDETFDLVVSSGVLHHTPDTNKAFSEAFRVLKSGGDAKITLYHKGLLHNKCLFPLTRFGMKLAGVKHPGADLAKKSFDVDDFIRQYDGAGNPVGIGKTTKEWIEMLEKNGFIYESHELHFFPVRFIPFNSVIPSFVHKFLDKHMGTMIYFNLKKK